MFAPSRYQKFLSYFTGPSYPIYIRVTVVYGNI